jgi:hypothetical protein
MFAADFAPGGAYLLAMWARSNSVQMFDFLFNLGELR